MLRQLPGAVASLEELVDGRGSVHQIGNPGVPIPSELLKIPRSKEKASDCTAILTSPAQSEMRRIRPPCSRPIVSELYGIL